MKERILKSRTGLFDLSHYNDIHLICGVVKDFLRSLSESLLTNALWKSFAVVIEEESDFVKQQNFDTLIQQLPKPNRDTLAFMILHLQRVANAPLCRMPILNLSRTMVSRKRKDRTREKRKKTSFFRVLLSSVIRRNTSQASILLEKHINKRKS